MTRWAHTVNIKPILHRDQSNTSPEHAATVAREIGAALRSGLPPTMIAGSFTLSEIVEGMEALPADGDALGDLNAMLSDLYDWADNNRVWLGA